MTGHSHNQLITERSALESNADRGLAVKSLSGSRRGLIIALTIREPRESRFIDEPTGPSFSRRAAGPARREAGLLPVAAPATAEEYLAERRALLERRLAEVAAKAAADRLEDVRIKGDELKITPLKAVTPEEAETLANRLYRMMPNLRITSLLAEVDRWTGFSGAFTHLHSGAPADDRRVVLTAVLADATNLGLTRMAEACAVASYRQLAWTAAWHLREETLPPGARDPG